MESTTDFEKLLFLYKTEGKNMSIESFCVNNGVNYRAFDKWYRNTHKNIVPVQIINEPDFEESEDQTPSHDEEQDHTSTQDTLISLSLYCNNGVSVKRRHLTFTQLKELIVKLEAMLTINSLRNFYYVPDVTDMRCGYHRLMQIVKHQFHRDPYSGDVFLFMSKDRTKVKIVHFEKHAYYLHEKKFVNGYKFMKIIYAQDDKEHLNPIYQISWKQVVAFLEMPVVNTMRIQSKPDSPNDI